LHVRSPQGDFNIIPAQVTDDPAEVGPADAVILGVKAWQVPGAARGMRPLVAPATKILALQNGVEAADQLRQILGRQHTLLGLCRIISSITSPGTITHAGLEPTIALAEPDGATLSANARALVDALQAAGVVVKTPPDIEPALWEKLVFIAAVSGVGAVTRSTIGEVRNCPPARRLLQQLMEEVVTVARARGVQLGEDLVARTSAFVESMPAGGTSSMQRDIAGGRPSELEEISARSSVWGIRSEFGLRRWVVFTPRFYLRNCVPVEGVPALFDAICGYHFPNCDLDITYERTVIPLKVRSRGSSPGAIG
jgi:2-dehydropantoate 2-reductase